MKGGKQIPMRNKRYIVPKTKEDLKKIYGKCFSVNQPRPSLQQQQDTTVDYMNAKIKSVGIDAP